MVRVVEGTAGVDLSDGGPFGPGHAASRRPKASLRAVEAAATAAREGKQETVEDLCRRRLLA